MAATPTPASVPDELEMLLDRLPELETELRSLATRQVRLLPAGPATDARSTFAGGHPYLPAGADWPTNDDGMPLAFLAQINFAQMPALDGFPTAGLLQWFVDADADCYGLQFDGRRTSAAHTARWYSETDLAADPVAGPGVVTLPVAATVESSPLTVTGPVALTFVETSSLPSTGELFEGYGNGQFDALQHHPAVADIEEREDNEFTDIYDPADLDDPTGIGAGDKVGGYPNLVQADPRLGARSHPAQADTLLLQLDSDGGALTEWGDGGAGWLFGDPAALASGDLSSLWWSWACH